MLRLDEIDALCTLIATFDRPAVTHHLTTHPAPFPLDFTAEFLRDQPLDRLRHILLGLCMHTQIPPADPAGAIVLAA